MYERILIIPGEEKPDLKHFGVLGMRWGRRKGSSNTRSYGKLKSKGVFDRKGNKAIRKAIRKDIIHIGKKLGKDVAGEMKKDFKSITATSKKLAIPVGKAAIAAAAGLSIGTAAALMTTALAERVYS